jgi:hypothetical protein
MSLSLATQVTIGDELFSSYYLWLRKLLKATNIRVDNKSAIDLAKNLVHHERSKHIDVRFYFIREHVKNGDVEMTHVVSRDQVADIFTKPLSTYRQNSSTSSRSCSGCKPEIIKFKRRC